MKLHGSSAASVLLVSNTLASPLRSFDRREVPQEHSHDVFITITNEALKQNNPKNIQDAVFGLLGNAAASQGAGSVTNIDCLKQETADQAFTNGKAAGDLRLMAGALVYQALERNTGKVGLASVACNEQPVNPEIAAIKPHQDPASANAASINKGSALELAKQLKSIGADPNLALMSGTFAPGNLNDATAKGNSCDDLDPQLGCIFKDGKLVLDATPDEVAAAAAGVKQTFNGGSGGILASDLVDLSQFSTANGQGGNTGGGSGGNTGGGNGGNTEGGNEQKASDKKKSSAPAQSVQGTNAAATGTDVQKFTGTLGGAAPPVVSGTGNRPFSVNGNTFVNAGAAISRSCDIQHNACANAANSGQLDGGVAQCEQQLADCKAANNAGQGNAGNNGSNGNGNNNAGNNGNNADNGNKNGGGVKGNAGNNAGNGDAGNQNGGNNNGDNAGNGNTGNGNTSNGNGNADNGNAGNGNNGNGNTGNNSGGNTGAGAFGSCNDPSIQFAEGLDGRKEASFAPVDQQDFNHGSALNIKIIADFICDRLQDQCKAGADTVANCKAASAAASQQKGQAAADAFNQALGAGN